MIFLSSCTIDWNDEKDVKTAELEKQIQDDTFKKKKDCLDLSDSLIKIYKSDIDSSVESFYSQKLNTCIFAYVSQPRVPANYDPNDPVNPASYKMIIDWLSKAVIMSTDSFEEWKNKLTDLKETCPKNDPLCLFH